tara:strand:+ start:11709 stop:12545 length:837 start_codon:yes stop_codon:yes gene_type:complete
MSKNSVYPLIFTDLDGTLLDHNSYSAKPADLLIRQISVCPMADIIPITSKTSAELHSLQQLIPIEESICVTENGSVIQIPDGRPLAGKPGSGRIMTGIVYSDLLDQIDRLPQKLREHIKGFADMSADDVAQATGLAIEDARLAKQREATEPFLWSGADEELAELQALMADTNIRIQRGGRFYHFTGIATKEKAMAYIKSSFIEQMADCEIISIALGDGPNDLAMIEAADFGVIMPNPEGVTIKSGKSHVRTAPAAGPQGWVLAVREIFAELGLNLPES